MSGLDGGQGDVFGDHGFAEAVGAEQNEIALGVNEFKAQRAFEQWAINLLRPVPVKIGDRAKASEPRLCEQALEVALGVIRQFALREFFKQHSRRESLACSARENVVELFGRRAQIELVQLRRQVVTAWRARLCLLPCRQCWGRSLRDGFA